MLIDAAVDTIDAPVLVGTLTKDAVGYRNTMQVFEPGVMSFTCSH